MTAPPRDALDELSGEFAITCSRDGRIEWADPRAARLGFDAGGLLQARVARGSEEKARALLDAASDLHDWEITMVTQGRPSTVSFRRQEREGHVLLLGRIIPDPLIRALDQVNESMEEVVRLNREVASQRAQLQQRNAALQRLNGELQESHSAIVAMHAELQLQSGDLRRAAENKGRIVSHLSHEIRTPIHSILGLARMLAETPGLAEDAGRQARYIRASAEELQRLVDDLLDLAQAEAGAMRMRIERFELGDFLATQRGVLRPLVPPTREIELTFEPLPTPIYLETDPGKLAQVLRNLVSNAIKFTPMGQVRVSVQDANDGHVAIRVKDTGIGIAPADQARIFEEFGQVHGDYEPSVKGTGLGLPLCRRLATMLGGTLSVESRRGDGSTFTLRIPAHLTSHAATP